MMKVIILGAGASHPAGYPLAANLLSSIEEHANSPGSSLNLQEAWREWESFRTNFPKDFRLVIFNPNPEIVLTLPDLLEMALRSEDGAHLDRALKRACGQKNASNDTSGEMKEYLKSPDREFLETARTGRDNLIDCLDNYFGYRHYLDQRQERRQSREYLRNLLSNLSPNDVVITFNWDTLVERTLGEAKRWNPTDGYGIKKQLKLQEKQSTSGQLFDIPKEVIIEPSEILVLKLHGSFGWRIEGERLWFESITFLDRFPFVIPDMLSFRIVDSDDPMTPDAGELTYVYPSFLKRLHPFLDLIWRGASQALSEAEEVEVWGYSLPVDDLVARNLFLPLVDRLERGEVKVTVNDPSRETRERWSTFLGQRVKINNAKLGNECLYS